jgi:hypothetical protein
MDEGGAGSKRSGLREGWAGARIVPSGRDSGATLIVESGFDPALLRSGDCDSERVDVIGQELPIYVALEPVDMRMGYERSGGLVRERMHSEPISNALFVFVGKREHTMKVLT